jgi:hypothetical protein
MAGPAADGHQQPVQPGVEAVGGEAETGHAVDDRLLGGVGQRGDDPTKAGQPHQLRRSVETRLLAPGLEGRQLRAGPVPGRLARVEPACRPGAYPLDGEMREINAGGPGRDIGHRGQHGRRYGVVPRGGFQRGDVGGQVGRRRGLGQGGGEIGVRDAALGDGGVIPRPRHRHPRAGGAGHHRAGGGELDLGQAEKRVHRHEPRERPERRDPPGRASGGGADGGDVGPGEGVGLGRFAGQGEVQEIHLRQLPHDGVAVGARSAPTRRLKAALT